MQRDHQTAIFEIIKQRTADQGSLGEVVGEILSISNDAVYRRYRGETHLTIYELEKLCKHFNISLDALFQVDDFKVIFDFQPLDHFDWSMIAYLQRIEEGFKLVTSMPNPKLHISVNHTHLLQLLNFPHLVRFKLFFWAKTHIQVKEYQDVKFAYSKITEENFSLGRNILLMYNSIPSTELYDLELLRKLAQEIQYYFQAHLFEDPTFAIYLLDQLIEFAHHLKAQVAIGKKFIFDTQPPADGNELEAYQSDTANGFGTIFYQTDKAEGLYLAHNILNILHTQDPVYFDDSMRTLERQIANSSKISLVNEKVRNDYFHKMIRTVENVKQKMQLELEAE